MIALKLITIACLFFSIGVNIWAVISNTKMMSKYRRIDEIELDLKDYREILEILLDIENERTKCDVLNRMITETKKEIEQLEKEYEELTKEGNK